MALQPSGSLSQLLSSDMTARGQVVGLFLGIKSDLHKPVLRLGPPLVFWCPTTPTLGHSFAAGGITEFWARDKLSVGHHPGF